MGSSGLKRWAPGVTPVPHMRMTHAGGAPEKTVWAYTGSIHQGEAYQVIFLIFLTIKKKG